MKHVFQLLLILGKLLVFCLELADGAVYQLQTVNYDGSFGSASVVCIGHGKDEHRKVWCFLGTHHCFDEAVSSSVVLHGQPHETFNLVHDPQNDLSYFNIKCNEELDWVYVANERPKEGEPIRAAGYTLGGPLRVREGYWRANQPFVPKGIDQGDSGGAVLNCDNRLVAMISGYEDRPTKQRVWGATCLTVRMWFQARGWNCPACPPRQQPYQQQPYQPNQPYQPFVRTPPNPSYPDYPQQQPPTTPTPQQCPPDSPPDTSPVPQPDPIPLDYVSTDQFQSAIEELKVLISKSPKCRDGEDGEDGRGIVSIELIRVSDNIHEFYVTYSDQTTEVAGQIEVPDGSLTDAQIQNIVNLVLSKVETPQVDIDFIVKEVIKRIDIGDPYEPPDPKRHVVVIGDPNGLYYNNLKRDVEKTKAYFDQIELIDPPTDRNVGTLPALVLYVDGKSALTKRGTNDVRTQLSRIRRGEFD